MTARNQLITTPPYSVEQALKRVGSNLRLARVRRKLTIDDIAKKIGAGRRAIMDAENGKASTGIAVYAALLWVYDLLAPFEELADPLKDEAGIALAFRSEKQRARKSGELDNDF